MLLHYFPHAGSRELEIQAGLHAALIDAIDRDDVAACNQIAGDMIAAILKVIRASLEPTAANQVDLSTAPLA
jgi:DNA-binding GntR family transcriptional regulator